MALIPDGQFLKFLMIKDNPDSTPYGSHMGPIWGHRGYRGPRKPLYSPDVSTMQTFSTVPKSTPAQIAPLQPRCFDDAKFSTVPKSTPAQIAPLFPRCSPRVNFTPNENAP